MSSTTKNLKSHDLPQGLVGEEFLNDPKPVTEMSKKLHFYDFSNIYPENPLQRDFHESIPQRIRDKITDFIDNGVKIIFYDPQKLTIPYTTSNHVNEGLKTTKDINKWISDSIKLRQFIDSDEELLEKPETYNTFIEYLQNDIDVILAVAKHNLDIIENTRLTHIKERLRTRTPIKIGNENTNTLQTNVNPLHIDQAILKYLQVIYPDDQIANIPNYKVIDLVNINFAIDPPIKDGDPLAQEILDKVADKIIKAAKEQQMDDAELDFIEEINNPRQQEPIIPVFGNTVHKPISKNTANLDPGFPIFNDNNDESIIPLLKRSNAFYFKQLNMPKQTILPTITEVNKPAQLKRQNAFYNKIPPSLSYVNKNNLIDDTRRRADIIVDKHTIRNCNNDIDRINDYVTSSNYQVKELSNSLARNVVLPEIENIVHGGKHPRELSKGLTDYYNSRMRNEGIRNERYNLDRDIQNISDEFESIRLDPKSKDRNNEKQTQNIHQQIFGDGNNFHRRLGNDNNNDYLRGRGIINDINKGILNDNPQSLLNSTPKNYQKTGNYGNSKDILEIFNLSNSFKPGARNQGEQMNRQSHNVAFPTMPDIRAPPGSRYFEKICKIQEAAHNLWVNMRIIRTTCHTLQRIPDKDPQEIVDIYKSMGSYDTKLEKFSKTRLEFSNDIINNNDALRSLPQWEQDVISNLESVAKQYLENLVELIDSAREYFDREKVSATGISKYDADKMEFYRFSGRTGFSDKNFYEFIENHVLNNKKRNTNSAVKASILKNHLDPYAKNCIPDSIDDFNEIVRILHAKYGDEYMIFHSIMENHKIIGKIPPRNTGDPEIWKKITDTAGKHLQLMKRSEHLVKFCPNMENDLLHPTYVTLLADHLCDEDHYKMFKTITSNPVGTYNAIKTLLTDLFEHGQKLSNARHAEVVEKRQRRNKKEETENVNQILAVSVNPNPDCIICQTLQAAGKGKNLFSNHIYNADRSLPAQCPLYIQMGAKERIDFCKEHKICDKCLKKKSGQHDECYMSARAACNERGCGKRVENCLQHINQNKDRIEKKKHFFEKLNLNYIMHATITNNKQIDTIKKDSNIKCVEDNNHTILKGNIKKNKDIVIQETDDTRPLEMPSIEDITNHPSTSVVIGNDTQALFIYGRIKGRKHPLNIIFDSGCTSVIIRDKIVGHEIVGSRDGGSTATLNGIGGKVQSHKWMISLPLLSSNKIEKTVATEAFSVEKIIEPLGTFDIEKIYNQFKNHPDNNFNARLSKIKLYKTFSGEVDILAGIKLYRYFPTPIFQLPNGLTIFKSILKPFDEKSLYSIGGPFTVVDGCCDDYPSATGVVTYLNHLINDFSGGNPNDILTPAQVSNINSNTYLSNTNDIQVKKDKKYIDQNNSEQIAKLHPHGQIENNPIQFELFSHDQIEEHPIQNQKTQNALQNYSIINNPPNPFQEEKTQIKENSNENMPIQENSPGKDLIQFNLVEKDQIQNHLELEKKFQPLDKLNFHNNSPVVKHNIKNYPYHNSPTDSQNNDRLPHLSPHEYNTNYGPTKDSDQMNCREIDPIHNENKENFVETAIYKNNDYWSKELGKLYLEKKEEESILKDLPPLPQRINKRGSKSIKPYNDTHEPNFKSNDTNQMLTYNNRQDDVINEELNHNTFFPLPDSSLSNSKKESDVIAQIEKMHRIVKISLENKAIIQDASFLFQPTTLGYRCPNCHGCKDCLKNESSAQLSRKEHEEEFYISKSIREDIPNKRFIATLPFLKDPFKTLASNINEGKSRIRSVLRRLVGKPDDISAIEKSFMKLVNLGYIKKFSSLPPDIQKLVDSQPLQYFIPWNLSYKSTSISTPVRTVFDASSKTATKLSLNCILAKGKINLDFERINLNFRSNKVGISADIQKFYNSLALDPIHYNFQNMFWTHSYDPNEEPTRYIITTAIYGVKSSSRQLERCLDIIADRNKSDEEFFHFLTKCRYVDDINIGVNGMLEAQSLIKRAETIFANYNLKVKAWVISGTKPDSNISEDGLLCTTGYIYDCIKDVFKIRVPPFHFSGRKERGRVIAEEYFDGSTLEELNNFVPNELNLKTALSKVAGMFDTVGLIDPFKLKFKILLRASHKEVEGSWEKPLSQNLRKKWVNIFFEQLKIATMSFPRFNMSNDVNTSTCTLFGFADASELGKQQIVYLSYKDSSGINRSQMIFAKNQISKPGITIPNLELDSLLMGATILHKCKLALRNVKEIYLFSDSTVALWWLKKPITTLGPFQRNRISEILRLLNNSLSPIMHVRSAWNIADIGTRIISSLSQIEANSVFHKGPDFLGNLEKAIEDNIITPIEKLKISDNDVIEGIEGMPSKTEMPAEYLESVLAASISQEIYDPAIDTLFQPTTSIHKDRNEKLSTHLDINTYKQNNKLHNNDKQYPKSMHIEPPIEYFRNVLLINKATTENSPFAPDVVVDRMKLHGTRKYIINPIEYGWKKSIDIVAIILYFLDKIRKRHRDYTFPPEEIQNFLLGFGNFSMITATMPNNKNSKRSGICFLEIFKKVDIANKYRLEAICYFLKKTSYEAKRIIPEKTLKKHVFEENEILFARSRISQFTELTILMDGLSPLDLAVQRKLVYLDRFSPVTISLVLHFHEIVSRHGGIASTLTYLNQVGIIYKGNYLVSSIVKHCIKCNIKNKKMHYVTMGPITTRLQYSYVNHSIAIDASGPYMIQKGHPRIDTRGSSAKMKVWVLHSICIITHYVQAEILMDYSTNEFIHAFQRMSAHTCFPKKVYMDASTSEIKGMTATEFKVGDLVNGMYYHYNIEVEICGTGSKSHSRNGLVEAKIKRFKQYLKNYTNIMNQLTYTQFDTIIKSMCSIINQMPLALKERNNKSNIAQFVSPRSFMIGIRTADQAPLGISLPVSRSGVLESLDLMSNSLIKFYASHIGSFLLKEKWNENSDEELAEGDLVLFEYLSTKMGVTWKLGRVSRLDKDSDKEARLVTIEYSNSQEIEYPSSKASKNKVKVIKHYSKKGVTTISKIYTINHKALDDDLKEIISKAKEI